MGTQPLSREQHRRILEMIGQGFSHRTIARELGVGVGTVSDYRHKPIAEEASDINPADSSQPISSSEMTADTWRISLPKTTIHTLEDLIAACEIDTSIWEVEKWICNKWDGFYVSEEHRGPKAEDGTQEISRNAETVPLYQVKAFLRKKKSVEDARKEIEELKQLAKADAQHFPPAIVRPTRGGNMAEINIPDVHHGKLAWGEETGGPNYDIKISRELHWRAFVTVVDRIKHHQLDEILLVIGNDLLNSDDSEYKTTAGTVVTTDGRYQKTFTMVRTLQIECILYLRKMFPGVRIKVVMVPGNHDTLSVWHLGDSLECFFHNCEDVAIDNSPRYRKYHRFGSVMLMFTHGDKAKRNDYPLLMATEQPVMFGATKFREAHTGHNHMTKMDEQHGVRVRVLPALCPADDWHAENGFVGNLRSAEAYIWNENEGLIDIAIFTEV